MAVVSVFDVAAYILKKYGPMSTMKLQKLCYYCQAWSLVWDEEPLFHEKIQAWVNGPIVPELFSAHRGRYTIRQGDLPKGDPDKLSEKQCETIDAVFNGYGELTAAELSNLTHHEYPWIKARAGLDPMEYGNQTIELGDMYEFYLHQFNDQS